MNYYLQLRIGLAGLRNNSNIISENTTQRKSKTYKNYSDSTFLFIPYLCVFSADVNEESGDPRNRTKPGNLP